MKKYWHVIGTGMLGVAVVAIPQLQEAMKANPKASMVLAGAWMIVCAFTKSPKQSS